MNVDISIGVRKFVGSVDLLVPEGEDAVISVPLSNFVSGVQSKITLKARFENTDDGVQGVRFDPQGDISVMTLKNWNNVLGTALKEPYALVSLTAGGFIDIMLSNYNVAGTNKLNIQFLLRE